MASRLLVKSYQSMARGPQVKQVLVFAWTGCSGSGGRIGFRYLTTTSPSESNAQPKGKPSSSSSLTESTPQFSQLTLSQKVAHSSKVVSYTGIIVAGFGILFFVAYSLYQEMFSYESPQVMYTEALLRVKNDDKAIAFLGEPMSGYGAESYRRYARRHINSIRYHSDGINYMRIQFKVVGPRNKATAHVEMAQNPEASFWGKKWEYSYLFIVLEGSQKGAVVVLEDNRRKFLEMKKANRESAEAEAEAKVVDL